MVSFPLGGCLDEAFDSQADYQGYRYDVNFLQWAYIRSKTFREW